MEPPPSGEWRGERELIMKRILVDGWNDLGHGFSVYLDSEKDQITGATKPDNSGMPGSIVSAGIYKPCKDGGWDNVLPCNRKYYIRHRNDLEIK